MATVNNGNKKRNVKSSSNRNSTTGSAQLQKGNQTPYESRTLQTVVAKDNTKQTITKRGKQTKKFGCNGKTTNRKNISKSIGLQI